MPLTISDVFDAVVDKVRQGGTFLDFSANADHRHRGFFIWRRTEGHFDDVVGGRPITRAELIARVFAEYGQVEGFEKTKLHALQPGQDHSSHQHLDLADLAKVKDTTSATVANHREGRYRRRRTHTVRSIIWRAAGIHEELWVETTGAVSVPGELIPVDLDELVDRRLRSVERLSCQMGDAKALGGTWTFTGGGDHGPWIDGFRTRMLEAPRIGIETPQALLKAAAFVGVDNIDDESVTPFAPGDPEWRWGHDHDALLYNANRVYLGPHMQGRWTLFSPLFCEFDKAGGTLVDAVELMFQPELDWWKRSWIPDDRVLSAVHLDALLFGRRRRTDVSDADAEFNALATGNPPGFIALGDHFDSGNRRLMSIPPAPHFDHTDIPPGELQVGDHVFVVNSLVFGHLAEGGRSHVLVLEVDSDHTDGTIHVAGVRVQSASGPDLSVADFQFVALTDRLNQVLEEARHFVARNPGATRLSWSGRADALVHWDPYEQLPGQGAWWVRINPGDFPLMTPADVFALVPRAVKDDPQPGPSYNHPPFPTQFYYPLFTPTFTDPALGEGWPAYLTARRSDTSVRTGLDPTRADRSDVEMDEFLNGKTITVIRPRVEAP